MGNYILLVMLIGGCCTGAVRALGFRWLTSFLIAGALIIFSGAIASLPFLLPSLPASQP